MLLVALDFRIVHLATNQTLSIEDSVFRVGVEGVLGGVADTGEMNAQSEPRPCNSTNRRLTVVRLQRMIPMKE